MKEFQFIILNSNQIELAVNIDNILYVQSTATGTKIELVCDKAIYVDDSYENVLLLLQSTIRVTEINK